MQFDGCNLSDLEKSIYSYIKLCLILIYFEDKRDALEVLIHRFGLQIAAAIVRIVTNDPKSRFGPTSPLSGVSDALVSQPDASE